MWHLCDVSLEIVDHDGIKSDLASLSENSFMRILDLGSLDWYRASEFGTGSGLIELNGAVGPFLVFWWFYAQSFSKQLHFLCGLHCGSIESTDSMLNNAKRLCLLILVSSAVWVDNLNKTWPDLRCSLEFRHERRGKLWSIISEMHENMKMSQCCRFASFSHQHHYCIKHKYLCHCGW